MSEEFQPNQNPELILPGLNDEIYNDRLTWEEINALRVTYPEAYGNLYESADNIGGDPYSRRIGPDMVRQMRELLLASQGVANPSARRARQEGIAYGGNAEGVHMFHAGAVGDEGWNEAKSFPATRVPKEWQMRHKSGRGGHVAYLGKTEAAYFVRKKAANAFVRHWNQMMSHLGSAAEFDQLRLSSIFAAVLDGGSGANGVGNDFQPPMNGQ